MKPEHDPGHEASHEPDAHDDGHGLAGLLFPHAHDYQVAALDSALATGEGIRAVKISLVVLLATAIFQVVIVMISGSTALLADTIHNFSDALTAVPLGLAFTLSRRERNPRFTYGYGRAEDIAGAVIVVMILFSAGEAIYQSALKIVHPQPIGNLAWVAAAAIIGFIGNEWVASYRIRAGTRIGSAALIADGKHARTDGFTSLAVLAGVLGARLGIPLLDPIVGLVIGVLILAIVWDAGRDMVYRIMDAVDPAITRLAAHEAGEVDGVMSVPDLALRWIGHRQRAELHVVVDCQLPTCESHRIAEEVRHELLHALPALVEVVVHVDPCECERCPDTHASSNHVRPSSVL